MCIKILQKKTCFFSKTYDDMSNTEQVILSINATAGITLTKPR